MKGSLHWVVLSVAVVQWNSQSLDAIFVAELDQLPSAHMKCVHLRFLVLLGVAWTTVEHHVPSLEISESTLENDRLPTT